MNFPGHPAPPLDYREIFERSIVGVSLARLDGTFISVNRAHVLSLEVVAEGVESAAQAAFLREAGCEKMQGFLFSRPVPSADFAALVRSGARLLLP